MSHELKEGVELEQVTLCVGETETLYNRVGSARPWCSRIVVVEQTGHMAMVPWARCEFHDGQVELVNLANVVSVELKREHPND